MGTTTDLTKGSVLKTLIKYAIPMVLTSVMQSLYSMVDLIIVGRFVGGSGLSAVNNGTLIMNLLVQIVIGFTVGGNILISRYFGAGDNHNTKKSSGTLFILCLIAGIVSSIAVFFTAEHLLIALRAPSLAQATSYLKICSVGIIFIFLYNSLSTTLRAIGNSKTPFKFIAVSTITNIVLDIVFISGFNMGVEGAALATVIAQSISFILALIYVNSHKEDTGFTKEYLKLSKDKAIQIFKYGFPMALQWTIASVSWLAVAYLLNQYGEDVSAGNGISNKIKELCQLFISATTSAAATMVAQNLGGKAYDRAEEVMKSTLKITLTIATGLIVVVQLAAPMLAAIFIRDPEVIGHAVRNLRIEIIAQLFYAGFMTYNILATGAGHTMFVMANSFLNCIIVRMFLAVVLERYMGLVGIYIACMIAPLSSVPVGYIYYKKGRWKK